MIAARHSMVNGNGGVKILDCVYTNAQQYSANWSTSVVYVGAYFDTGYKDNKLSTYEVECGWVSYQNQGWDAILGSGSSGVWNSNLFAGPMPKWDHPKNPCVVFGKTGSPTNFVYGNSGSVSLDAPTDIVKIIAGPSAGFKIYNLLGVLVYSENAKDHSKVGSSLNLYIGGTNFSGRMVNPAMAKIRRVTISESGTVVHDFRAAKSGSACGFVDLITGVFHESSSSTPFTETPI